MNSSRLLVILGTATLGVSIFAACGSKFSESSAKSVSIKGLSLTERLAQKEKIDSRIDQIQQGANKAKKIIEMLKQVQNPSATSNVYTPIDFIIEANEELKSKLPANQKDKLARFGSVDLRIDSLPEECRKVETSLLSTTVFDEATGEQPIGDRLTYSLKTCGTDGKYVDVAVADWTGPNFEIKFNNKNLETLFKGLLKTASENSSGCKFTIGEKSILDTLTCENINIDLSKSENAIISKLYFSNSGEIRYKADADIFENAKLKAHLFMQILSNGEKELTLQKVEEQK